MSGSLNGSAQRPRKVVDNTLVLQVREEMDAYKSECSADRTEIREAVAAIRTDFDGIRSDFKVMTAKLDTVLGIFVKPKAPPVEGGATEYVFHLPKISPKRIFKAVLVVAGAFSGLVGIFQLSVVMLVPAIKAGLEWVMTYGH